MKRLSIPIVFVANLAMAASMNFGGSFRGEAAYYNRLSLSGEGESTKTYLSGRGLLNPNLVIDDHFSVNSEWSLLTSPNYTPNPNVALGSGQGGWIFGDNNTLALVLSRAWLEWTSDFGVFRLGRMPVSWGYGLVWDAGNGVWDDFQTTLDRLEYRLHFGHIIGAVAYSKPKKRSVLGSQNDQDLYTIYLRYENPELEVDGGILYVKQVRSTSQNAELINQDANYPDFAPVIGLPESATPSNLTTRKKTAYPMSSNVVDVYLRKTFGYFTFGGEFAWLSGNATDYNLDGSQDSLSAFGLMVSSAFEYHKVKAFVDFMYASGDANLNEDPMSGFVVLNRNRRVGIILGHELLGIYHGNHAAKGSMVAYGANDAFSGVYYVRPGFRVDWSPSWSTGVEFIWAQKAVTTATEDRSLGVEIDFGTEYAVYRNFNLGATFGFLIPGKGLNVVDPQSPVAFRVTSALKF